MLKELLSKSNLNAAYQSVVRNKGACGVDGMEVEELKAHLQINAKHYLTAIEKGNYQVSAIKAVNIPKSNGKTRQLGIPTVVDRMFQQAISQVLSPIWEQAFSQNSYGFRPNRNAHQALKASQGYIHAGYQDIVDIDLKRFFDEVSHDKILQLLYEKVKCKYTLKLIRQFLKAPISQGGKLHKRSKGLPQGAPLSPILSNILLHELDKELERRGHRFVRYADDFSIYVKSKRAAKRVGNSVYLFLKKQLNLPINREKSGIRRPSNFRLLGHGYVPTYKKGEKGKYQFVVEAKKWKKLKRELKEITRKTTPASLDERLARINRKVKGWINYFKNAAIHAKLKKLDEWLRNRLRYCIWHDWKKPKRKRKSLIRLGIKEGMAYAWSRTRMGGWAVAQSPILGTTITKARLSQRGYVSLIDYYYKIRSSS